MAKKFISEFVGTFMLVFFGCGTAVVVTKLAAKGAAQLGVNELVFTLIPIALAFGLILTACAYTIGKVSGAHVNPAVSVAMLIDGRIDVIECVEYIIAQVLGAIAGAGALSLVLNSSKNLGANGFDSASALGSVITTPLVAIVIEAILTFVFVLVVLSVTAKDDHNNAGIIVGLALALVHILGTPFTGTSVNPARSIGPALLQTGDAINYLWVFIIGPMVGGVLAALFYKFIVKEEAKPAKAKK